jgi:hypothetical protein
MKKNEGKSKIPLEHVKEEYNKVWRSVILVSEAPNNCLRHLKGIWQQQVYLWPSAENAVLCVELWCKNMTAGSENIAKRFALA